MSERRALALGFSSILCGNIINYLDQATLPVALPAIGLEFGATPTLVQWIANGYTLLSACLVLLGGKIGDSIGSKNGFLVGLVLFALFSTLCGCSPNIGWLISMRALQALGTSLLFPAQAALLSHLFPVHQQRRATALLLTLGMMAGFLGPSIGGLLTQLISWRAIFWVNVPITLFGFLLGWRSLPKMAPIKRPIDYKGFVYFTLTLCPIVLLAMQVNSWGQRHFLLLFCSLISAVFLIRRTVSAEHPFFDFKLLKYPAYSAILLSVCIIKFIMMIYIFQTIYFQTVLNYTQIETGMLFSCSFFPSLICSPLGGYLADKISPKLPIAMGYLLLLFSLFWLSFHSIPSLFDLLLALIIYGMGLPLILTPSHALVLSCIPKDKVGMGASMIASLRMTAASLGLAMIHLFTTTIQRIAAPHLGAQGAMTKSFAHVHLGLALLGTATLLTIFFLHNRLKDPIYTIWANSSR